MIIIITYRYITCNKKILFVKIYVSLLWVRDDDNENGDGWMTSGADDIDGWVFR
jgi:hypothetical protein